ncbi:MAG: histidine phosphatase family protein [Burkholderiales bacterium]|nr:histidine phosphatase family protein [Burkholderiales bacterium]
MTIYLVRHGETPLNAARVMQPPDTPLSERGSAQALAVADRLKSVSLAGILSSDLRRAYDTARPIAEAQGLTIQPTALLHERNFGDLRGKSYDNLGFNPFEMEGAPPGGESIPDFLARVAKAFDQAIRLRDSLKGPLAIVSHGLVIKAIMAHHARLPEGIEVPERVANTSVTVFSDRAPHEITLLNCATHLDGKLAEDGSSLSGG